MFNLITIIICIVLLMASILFFPTLKLGKISLSTYWMVALVGALVLLIGQGVSWSSVWASFTSNNAVNPLKILVLFISNSLISIFLDEIGLFSFIAYKAALWLKGNQLKLFLGFYALVSILTIFTSNDIVILTFTPFIAYYCKNAKIKPIPYLVAEFVAANSYSMLLIIGNPTNIYLATSFSIDFFAYFKQMALPTLFAGIVSLGLLLLLFHKSLKEKMQEVTNSTIAPDRFLTILGLVHLFGCLILLAISSYINLEMWAITLGFALSLFLISSIYTLLKKDGVPYLTSSLKRAPWALIPFVLSMFVLVLALDEQGYCAKLATLLGDDNVFIYGFSTALSCNLINNIPSSVLFSSILANGSVKCVYASIIGTNIGAFLTPIGALAGIMWMSLLQKQDIRFSFLDFMKYGCLIGIPTLGAALAGLLLI